LIPPPLDEPYTLAQEMEGALPYKPRLSP
jgi:hypothetical protein